MTKIFNDHNVYVLGAGFSAARGLPLTTNFLFALRDAHPWLVANGRTAEAAAIQNVLEFRLTSASAAYRIPIDLENIEELFSLASAAGDALARDIRIAIAATLDFSSSTAPVPTTGFRMTPDGPSVPAFRQGRAESAVPGASEDHRVPTYDFVVAGLLGLLGEPRETATNTFVSFNYDLLVEKALSALAIPFSYGLGTDRAKHDPSTSCLTLSDSPHVLLLKLHGSTNWSLSAGSEDQLTIYGEYEDVQRSGHTPELIPPTWRKSYSPPLAAVWNHALGEFKKATRIVIIGFSIPPTDLHFKYLLAAGLRENISLREIVFVNHNKTTIEQRAADLFGDLMRRPRVRIAESKAAPFVGQGMFDTTTWSIGRPLHIAIQSVVHPF
jgi:hypothetical protein